MDVNGTLQSDVSIFGQSWLTLQTQAECALSAEEEVCDDQSVLETCDVLRDQNAVFAECVDSANEFPVATFYENCLYDLCLDEGTKCGIMRVFAQVGGLNHE